MTANRSDQVAVDLALRDLTNRVRILEANPVVGNGGGAAGRESWGSLLNDVTVLDPGSGDWTAEWNDHTGGMAGTGVYTLRFATPYTSFGSILATANNNNAAAGFTPPPGGGGPGFALPYFAEELARDPSFMWVEIVTYAWDGTLTDGGWNFLILGNGASA